MIIQKPILKEDIHEGMYIISLVEDPAIQEEWQFFNQFENFKKSKFKGELLGPTMIPNRLIQRDKDRFVTFSENDIKNIVYLWSKKNLRDNFNVEHDGDVINDVFIIESWIIESLNDKTYDYFTAKQVPVGSHMVKVKFDNLSLFEEIIKSKKGFSIELHSGWQELSHDEIISLRKNNILKFVNEKNIGQSYDDFIKDKKIIKDEPLTPEFYNDIISKYEIEKFEIFDSSKIDNPLNRIVGIEDNEDEGIFTRYVYRAKQGEDDVIQTSRDFCREMMSKKLVFSLSDVVLMNRVGANPVIQPYGLDLMDVAGGWNCRHEWRRIEFTRMLRDNIPESDSVSFSVKKIPNFKVKKI